MPSDQFITKAKYSFINFSRQYLNVNHNPDTYTSPIDFQALIA